MAEKQPHDVPMLMAIIIFVVALVCICFWFALSTQISSGVRWIRIAELYMAHPFVDKVIVPGPDGAKPQEIVVSQLIDSLKALRPEDVTPIFLLRMTQATSSVIQIPVCIVLLAMGLICFFRKETHPYTRKMKLEDIVKEQAAAFPVTSPIVKFNPLQANHRMMGSPLPERLPIFAEALTPEEWVAFHSIPIVDGTIEREAARIALAKQLSGRWKGVDALPMHAKALFAAFSMKANGKRTESDEFLGRVAQCWSPRGLALTAELRGEINKIIRDPKFGRVTEKVAAQHAFVAPALLRCLQVAREQGGVLAPAQFLWLRAVDRTLWYALNNLGRGAVHAEAAGSIAHFRTEKAAGKPIPNPQVDIAVDGLGQYLEVNEITTFPAKEFARA